MDQLTLLENRDQDERGKVESWRLHVLMEAGYPLPLASLAPLAVAGSKRLLDEGRRQAVEHALDREAALCEQLFETADAREGLAAFLEKREPEFRGS